ncbi:MAG: hypothetical protein ACFUZC_01800 [Chthoniobacteraceae bacterium]
MKIQKFLAAGVLTLALAASSAHADYTIRIAGSSAYRSCVHQAILEILNTDSGTKYMTIGGKDINSTNAAIFSGSTSAAFTYNSTTIPANTKVTICTSWTGSVAGVYALANATSTTIGFIPADATITNAATNATASDKTSTVDIAMSDVFLSTAASVVNAKWTSSTITEAKGGSTYNGIGICPFKWLISGVTSGVTNISTQNVQALYNAGIIDQGQLTAGSSLTGNYVYAFGRDNDSGTRLTAFAEAGLGATFLPSQYGLVSGTSLVTNVNNIDTVPQEVIITGTLAAGQGGYASGGDLASALAFTGSNGSLAIAYVSVADANKQAGKVADLNYNGVPYSVNNVINGSYTFWSYEHMFYLKSAKTTSGVFAEKLANQLYTKTVGEFAGTDLTSGTAAYIKVSDMQVSRSDDGDIVTQ